LSTPRIGCVKYLNARPLIQGWPDPVVFDHPAALCRKLAAGELDVALVSSVEYLRRPQYLIIDGISIAAFGPVYSVILAYEDELARVNEIETDPASETSLALLRCLLAHRGLTPRLNSGNTGLQPVRPAELHSSEGAAREQTPRDTGGPESRTQPRSTVDCKSARRTGHRSVFLIGDQAIRFRQMHPQYHFWDLAEEWKDITGLPFVFALWLVRPEVAGASEIANRLRALRDKNLRRLEAVVAAQTDFDGEFVRHYFHDYLRFDFGDSEKAGLREFNRRCISCGIDVLPTADLNVV
jgi:chorismate dehydratase